MKHHSFLSAVCLTALVATAPLGRAVAAPEAGKLGPDLFMAVGGGDLASVKALLERGADPNARNFLGFTPLTMAAATGQVEKIELLLAAGAKLDVESILGTPLVFAGFGPNSRAAEYLIEKGANINHRRPDGITILMLAARSGQTELVRKLAAKGADVNGKDTSAGTALIWAARDGHTETVRALLELGAAVNAADNSGWTALTHAVTAGHADVVALLLAKGGNPNTRDKKGRTPLMLAATYSDDAAVIRALLAGGANVSATDSKGRTALALAEARGNAAAAKELGTVATVKKIAATGANRTPATALAASLPRIQDSMRIFAERTGCASCHHEGLARVTTGFAAERQFLIDTAVAKSGAKRVRGTLEEARPLHVKALTDPEAMKQVPGYEIGEVAPVYSFLLAGMAAHREPADASLAAAAMVLARQQAEDGSWGFQLYRVPMQSSRFTMTALAIRALQAYAPKDRGAEVKERLNRARNWLLTAKAENTEDRALRLLGLKWLGTTPEERRAAIEELRAGQRPDGGWAQLPTMRSDAYATGQAVFALAQGGNLPTTDAAVRKGVEFLVRTQEDDGTWYVSKRAIPANNYFDAGYSHGMSQYSSHAAACWATLALAQVVAPPAAPRPAAAQQRAASRPRPTQQPADRGGARPQGPRPSLQRAAR